ncbi:NUDIX hydrolase [Defluviimonas salinarum]|uniref:NUDIX hydrolase n=1 Tax=Defluviimonas salinarum TaxID=2992147 RepID=A0ABT3J494_9RHOB|nr:NUDIX hydrolase [Defluviimonas salinarum]MCW3782483.1 NUDIX hydrolase [Defluviimonas salinarum]
MPTSDADRRDWRPIATVDTVILTLDEGSLKVLVHRRQRAPFAGAWALPGGYIRPGEDDSAEEAALRVLRTKAGLPNFYIEQLATYSGPARDPRGWSISVAFLALVPRDLLPDLAEDVSLAAVDGLPDLAFDHGRIVRDAVARLRGKGAYSSLPAALLPESFTLPELQRAYEIVLGDHIDASSFRRKVLDLDMIEETGEAQAGVSKRPAKLYRLTGAARTFNRTLGAA